MRILIGCEWSGIVRDAFYKLGYDAYSCDLISTELPGKHYKGDIFDIIDKAWDIIIVFPPCTYLCVAGNKYYADSKERKDAIKFVEKIWDNKCSKMCIENPVGVLSTQSKLGKPSQYIQPWQFGHGEQKKNLFMD